MKLHGEISHHWQPNYFCYRQTVRMIRFEALAICSSVSRHAQEMHRTYVEDGLVLVVICRWAVLNRLGVG